MKTKKWYARQLKRRPIEFTRHGIQIMFLFFLMYVGVRFYQFYIYFSSQGVGSYVERPSAVEGFLPISALVALKVWVTTGEFDHIHPAGLLLFTFFIGSGILFRKAFCSWICPVGTISEMTGMLGKKIFKKNYDLPKWATWILYPLKYLLLAFFLKLIIFDMPVLDAKEFLLSPYNQISDVKMLLFFLNIGGFALKFIIVVFLISLFVKNFWCRFLCPYGALIGLGSLVGITKIKRNEDSCINCNACTRVCPQRIKVSEKKAVLTPECSSCMLCVEACPVKDTLNMHVGKKKVNKWVVPVVFFIVFAIIVITAKLTGNWNTSISFEDFRQLIPSMDYIGH
ncbi:4Fe-4S binding protein [Bacillus sp. 1NLA3E]|uniref:4Fe-4S binding protein n=1 Tax=Bacillus sp. 1NLA3E TaxID=666686 RepID=UPI000247E7BA|nr:4Fe-4S binding protein [Bacillus sp. 1NLA3E]AGK52220.1 polyferredoxin [Bacillus sp. 1NLA3E]